MEDVLCRYIVENFYRTCRKSFFMFRNVVLHAFTNTTRDNNIFVCYVVDKFCTANTEKFKKRITRWKWYGKCYICFTYFSLASKKQVYNIENIEYHLPYIFFAYLLQEHIYCVTLSAIVDAQIFELRVCSFSVLLLRKTRYRILDQVILITIMIVIFT